VDFLFDLGNQRNRISWRTVLNSVGADVEKDLLEEVWVYTYPLPLHLFDNGLIPSQSGFDIKAYPLLLAVLLEKDHQFLQDRQRGVEARRRVAELVLLYQRMAEHR